MVLYVRVHTAVRAGCKAGRGEAGGREVHATVLLEELGEDGLAVPDPVLALVVDPLQDVRRVELAGAALQIEHVVGDPTGILGEVPGAAREMGALVEGAAEGSPKGHRCSRAEVSLLYPPWSGRADSRPLSGLVRRSAAR